MSDLAPFVAATLRDKVVVDLQDENERMKQDNERLRTERAASLVTVTSPDDPSRIYAERSLSNREIHFEPDSELIIQRVKLSNSTGENASERMVMCPVREIENAVVRVGNTQVCTLSEFDSFDVLLGLRDEFEDFVYWFNLDTDPTLANLGRRMRVYVMFGPTPEGQRGQIVTPEPTDYQNEDIAEVRFTEIAFWNRAVE